MGQIGQFAKPATAAGRLILEAIQADYPARSLSRLTDSPRALRLLRELFTVATRRSFTGRDPREITRYVRELLAYRSQPVDGRLAREVEALIRAMLGEAELARELSDERRFDIVCQVVGDLGRPPGMPLTELLALIDQAEQRVARFDRPRNRTIGRRSR